MLFRSAAQSYVSANVPSSIPAAPAQSKVIFAYDMGPNGCTFNPGITIMMSYSAADITGLTPSSLYIGWWDGTTWNKVASTVDTTARTVSATITHFTTFALIGVQAPPPTSTNPPTQTTNPPTQTTNPPTQTTNPPTQTTNPPTQTTNPPSSTSTGGGVNGGVIAGIVIAAILVAAIIALVTRKPKKS